MNMELPQENNVEKKESLSIDKPITPELLLEDGEVLEKIYKVLTNKKVKFFNVRDSDGKIIEGEIHRYEYINDIDIIDFGPEYEKTNLKTILFYVACYTGLFSLQYDDGMYLLVQDYIKLLYEDKKKAELYLEEQLSKRNEEQIKKCDMVSNGRNLSTIIPEAQELVTQPMINGTKSDIGTMDTDKASFLISSKNKEQLEKIFEGKTMVDLGAGSGAAGIRIAEILKAKNYIGVEPFNTHKLLFFSAGELYYCKTRGETMTDYPAQVVDKFHIAKTDMRTFLQKLPSSVENTVFFISGVDDLILGSDHLSSKNVRDSGNQYSIGVYNELNRLVTKGNVLVVYESNFGLSEKDGFTLHILESNVGFQPIHIYEKV